MEVPWVNAFVEVVFLVSFHKKKFLDENKIDSTDLKEKGTFSLKTSKHRLRYNEGP